MLADASLKARLLLALLVVAALALGAACSASSSAAFASDSTPSPTGGGSTVAKGPEAGADVLGVDSAGVILVHASPNLPAFRACFGNRGDLVPEPRTKVMPESNVVGVEAGTAVHVGDLFAKLEASSGGDGGTALDPQKIYLFDEARLRDKKDVLCRDLLRYPLVEGKDFWRAAWNPAILLAKGVYLISVEGCRADATNTKLDARVCGAGFSPAAGSLRVSTHKLDAISTTPDVLAAQVLVLSDAVRDAIDRSGATAGFGPLAGPVDDFDTDPSGTEITPASPQRFSFPGTIESYDTHGFVMTIGKRPPFSQTLAETQRLTSPLTVPQDFYKLPSNFVLLVLGDDTLTKRSASDPGLALHFLTIPVRDPDTLPEAGAPDVAR